MRAADAWAAVDGGSMRMSVAAPDGEADHAVIVVPEAFGLNDHIEDVVRRLAGIGMAGAGIDIFHRSGGGVAPYDDLAAVRALFAGLTDGGLLEDLDAARTHLHGLGFTDDRLAVVGFCFGGRVAFLAALERALGAAVTFYGAGIAGQGAFEGFPPLIDRVGELRTPWLGLFGDRDRAVPVADVENLRSALASADVGVATGIVRYPDAEHGFHCDDRPAYDRETAVDAWQRCLEHIRRS